MWFDVFIPAAPALPWGEKPNNTLFALTGELTSMSPFCRFVPESGKGADVIDR